MYLAEPVSFAKIYGTTVRLGIPRVKSLGQAPREVVSGSSDGASCVRNEEYEIT